MPNQPFVPDPSVDQRLLGNLHRTRLELEELGLQLGELLAKFDEEIRQQRMKWIQKSCDDQNFWRLKCVFQGIFISWVP